MTDYKTDVMPDVRPEEAGAIATSQQMMSLLEVQALSLNMNNAANAQQNAYTLNTAIIGSICKRILAAGSLKIWLINKSPMETNKDIQASGRPEMFQLAQLYLSTSETLARYAYEASVKQQQLNILAQQVTVNSVRDIYGSLRTAL